MFFQWLKNPHFAEKGRIILETAPVADDYSGYRLWRYSI